MKNKYFWLVFVFILYFSFESISFFTLALLAKYKNISYHQLEFISTSSISQKHKKIIEELFSSEKTYKIFDSHLGWSHRPNGSTAIYKANSKGIRASQEFSLQPKEDTLRMAAFGDSYTHCSDVKNNETWEENLNQMDTRYEVMNFGVGAYGLDQAYLRYQYLGVQYHPQIVFIGFMNKNIARNVNVYRPFYRSSTSIPLSKPRYILKNNKLKLIKNPLKNEQDYQALLARPKKILRKLGQYDYFYNNLPHQSTWDIFPSVQLAKIIKNNYFSNDSQISILLDQMYNRDSEGFNVTTVLFKEFYQDVLKNESIPVILLFPNKSALTLYLHESKKIYQPLIDDFHQNSMGYIDLLEAFKKGKNFNQVDELFKEGHYSVLANKIVAQYIFSKRHIFLINGVVSH